MLKLITCLLLINSMVFAHKDGAPLKACMEMTPGHTGTSPQPLETAIHKLMIAPAPQIKSVKKDSIVVTLNGAKGAFKGFFIQARSLTSGDVNPVGVWDVSAASGLAKGVDCGDNKDSAVTHIDNTLKPSVSLFWTPPEKFSGKVVFVATVVQEYKTYWVGIQSEGLTLPQNSKSGISNSITFGSTTNSIGTNGTLYMSSTTTTPGLIIKKDPKIPILGSSSTKSSKSDLSHPIGSAHQFTDNKKMSNVTTAAANVITICVGFLIMPLFQIVLFH